MSVIHHLPVIAITKPNPRDEAKPLDSTPRANDPGSEPGDLPRWVYQLVGGITLLIELLMAAIGIWFFLASKLFGGRAL